MLQNEINTYVSEMILKFITGDEPFDKYDAYLNRIREMGINEVIEIQQNALDRYNAR